MKSNVIMTRPLGKFEVYQRTRDGMFNATSLLAQWNKAKNSNKRIQDFFENQNTKDFIEALMEEENLKVPNLAYLKTRGKYNGGTWMHPYLFVKFAMWLNPRFEVKVVKFVYDQLIEYRHHAGDNYNVLARSIAALPDVDYSQVARHPEHGIAESASGVGRPATQTGFLGRYGVYPDVPRSDELHAENLQSSTCKILRGNENAKRRIRGLSEFECTGPLRV